MTEHTVKTRTIGCSVRVTDDEGRELREEWWSESVEVQEVFAGAMGWTRHDPPRADLDSSWLYDVPASVAAALEEQGTIKWAVRLDIGGLHPDGFGADTMVHVEIVGEWVMDE